MSQVTAHAGSAGADAHARPDGSVEEARLREAQEALQRSQEQLRVALAVARLGTWERDLRTGELVASEICKTSLGLPADMPLTYEQLEAMRHPDDRERVAAAVEAAVTSGRDYDVDYRIVRPDGSIGRILARGHAIYEDGRPVRMVGVTLDVTEREQARAALERSERRQKLLLALNDRLRSLDDPEAVMAAASEMLARHLGTSRVGYAEVDAAQETLII